MIDDRALIALIILAVILLIVAADVLINGRERPRPQPLGDWSERDFGDLVNLPIHERTNTDA